MDVPDDVDIIFEGHYARLVRSLAVAFDHESAADAVQEAFVEADRQWAKVSNYADPVAWVRRVAVNRLLNDRRNRRRRREILASIPPPGECDQPDTQLDLLDAVEQLPAQVRLAICLHYLADLPVDAVADTLDIAPGTVKSHLHDGRRRLRAILEDNSYG